MKKWAVVLAVVPLIFLFTIASPAKAELTGNVNLLLGGKFVDADLGFAENHFEYGVGFDFKKEGWPVSIVVEYLRSSGEESVVIPFFGAFDIELTTWDFNLGVRKTFDRGNMHPYVGGGLSIIGVELEMLGFPAGDDTSVGGWLGGGAYWTLNERFNVGADLKYSFAGDGGGFHISGLAGYHF